MGISLRLNKHVAAMLLISLAIIHQQSRVEAGAPELATCYEGNKKGFQKSPCAWKSTHCNFRLSYTNENGRWDDPEWIAKGCKPYGPRGNFSCDPVAAASEGWQEFPAYDCYCARDYCNLKGMPEFKDAIKEINENIHGTQQPTKCHNADNVLTQCHTFGETCEFSLTYGLHMWETPKFQPIGCSNHTVNNAKPCGDPIISENPQYTCYCDGANCTLDKDTSEVKSAIDITMKGHGPRPLQCIDDRMKYDPHQCQNLVAQCQHHNETCGFQLRYKYGKAMPSIYSATGCQPPKNTNLDSCEKSGKDVYPQYDCRCGTTKCNQNDTTEAVAAAEKIIDALHAGQAKNQPGTLGAPIGLHV